MTPQSERQALQIAVAVAAIVPVAIGMWGILAGFGAPGLFADSHFRYLSAILFGIGLTFWFLIPRIEQEGRIFRLLCALVVLGGLARAATGLAQGVHKEAAIALVMELLVTPALFFWRERVERLTAAVDEGGDAL